MNDLIDYAHPLMMAERALKKAHDYLLEGDYTLALDQLKLAIVETRAASTATIHMQEKSDALR
jgi:uncharacterized membrane protein YpjA